MARCVLTRVPGGYPLANVDIELVRTDSMLIVQVVQTNKAGEAQFTTTMPGPCFFRPRIIGKNWNLQVTDTGLGYSLYDRVVDLLGLGTDLNFTSAIAALAATGGTIGARSGDYEAGAILTIPTTKNYVIEGIGHGILEDVSYTPVMGVQIHNPGGAGGFDGVIFHVDSGARLTLRGVEVHQDRNYAAIQAHTSPWIVLEDSYVHSDGNAAAIDSSYMVRIHRSVVTVNTATEVIDVAATIVYLECSESRLTGSPLINGSFAQCILEKCIFTSFNTDTTTIADTLRIEDCKATGGIILIGGQHRDLTITGNECAYIAVGHNNVGGTVKRCVIGNNILTSQYSFDAIPVKYACIALSNIQGLVCVGNVGVAKLHAPIDEQYVVECWGTVTFSAFAANTWDGLPDAGDVIDAVYGPGIPTSMIAGAGGDHGVLTGLLDDDHTQYLLAAGTRALSGNWNPGAFIIGNYDYTAKPAALYVGDGNNGITLEAGGPIWTVDTGTDFLGYVRASNCFTFVTGGVSRAQVDATGLLVDHILELAGAHGVDIDGVLCKDDAVETDAIRGLRTTTGPTSLAMGAVADGEYLRRVGTDIVGGTPAGGGGGFIDRVFLL